MNKKHIIFLISLAVIAGLAFMLFDQEKTTDKTENHQANNRTQNQATTTQYKSYTTDSDKEEYMIPKVEPKKYSELTPLPEDFEEFVIASGTVRFGVPREWGMVNSHTGKNDFGYKTNDYNQIIATEIPYGDDDFAVKSGYLIGIRKGVYYHDRYGSRCSVAANPKTCFETNLLDDWYTYRLNDNIMLPENLQYI